MFLTFCNTNTKLCEKSQYLLIFLSLSIRNKSAVLGLSSKECSIQQGKTRQRPISVHLFIFNVISFLVPKSRQIKCNSDEEGNCDNTGLHHYHCQQHPDHMYLPWELQVWPDLTCPHARRSPGDQDLVSSHHLERLVEGCGESHQLAIESPHPLHQRPRGLELEKVLSLDHQYFW